MPEQITAVDRPFILSFPGTRYSFPMSSHEAQTLLDSRAGEVLDRDPNRVVLINEQGDRAVIEPATLGGGRAFTY